MLSIGAIGDWYRHHIPLGAREDGVEPGCRGTAAQHGNPSRPVQLRQQRSWRNRIRFPDTQQTQQPRRCVRSQHSANTTDGDRAGEVDMLLPRDCVRHRSAQQICLVARE